MRRSWHLSDGWLAHGRARNHSGTRLQEAKEEVVDWMHLTTSERIVVHKGGAKDVCTD